LLKSQHFYHGANDDNNAATVTDMIDDNFGGIIKSPIDLVLGTYRFFGIKFPDMVTETADFYAKTGATVEMMKYMGLNFYEPSDVAGYNAYHQYPIYHRAWITPNYLAERYSFVRNVITYNQANSLTVDVHLLVQNNFAAVAGDALQLIINLAQYFLPVSDNLTFDTASDDNATLTANRTNYFKERFLQNLGTAAVTPEAYWASRWGGPDIGELRSQLEFLFNAMMQSPEYQLA
jgi:hypothetical protein